MHEVIAVQKAKPLRFDYSGMVLVIRGHEELFFEIGSARKRDDLLAVIVHELYAIIEGQTKGAPTDPKQELQDLEALHKLPSSPSNNSELSQIMFSSATSSFITFQPPQPLHSTFSVTVVTTPELKSVLSNSHLSYCGIPWRCSALYSIMLRFNEGRPQMPYRFSPRVPILGRILWYRIPSRWWRPSRADEVSGPLFSSR